MLEFVKASTSDALVINGISKRSFDSDAAVGHLAKEGPPRYMSVQFHTKMARTNHLYKLLLDGLIIGAAILLRMGRNFTWEEYLSVQNITEKDTVFI